MRSTLKAAAGTAVCGLCVFILLLGAGCRSDPPASGALAIEAIATVNGEEITIEDFEIEEKISPLPYTRSTGAEIRTVKQAILQQLIDRKLLLQEAARRGIQPSSAEVKDEVQRSVRGISVSELNSFLQAQGSDATEWQHRVYEQVVIDRLLQDVSRRVRPPTRAEERSDYEKHLADHREPEMFRVRHILAKSEKQVRIALTMLQQGLDFGEVAAKRSIAPDRARGGDWGYMSEKDLPREFTRLIVGLKLGEVSRAVKSPWGWHLFMLEDRRKARILGYDSVRAAVRERLWSERKQKAIEIFLADLKKNAKIEVKSLF